MFVFDWSWADAYHRHGLDYYPKLLAAIPFTPASGPRLLAKAITNELMQILKKALNTHAKKAHLSGWHILFPDKENLDHLKHLQGVIRQAWHFQWFNAGFNSFDDFLDKFSSRKRKNLKKERQKVLDAGIKLKALTGIEIEEPHWQCLEHCYRVTYAKRSGHGGYLTEDFFKGLRTMADKILLVVAVNNKKPIACALNFYSDKTLYGRYWGALEDVDGLHFEACYYQGIEFCIKKGLASFDPGVQGEHKVARGFQPVITYSLHCLMDSRFNDAVHDFCQEEAKAIAAYQAEIRQHLPFKKEL